MTKDQPVKLKTFNGENYPNSDCDPSENYWQLIGKAGVVVKNKNCRGRVLVQFHDDIGKLGLHCHNEVPNSLFILPSDLQAI